MRPVHSILLAALVLGSACAAPVGVERIDPKKVQRELTANVLTQGDPSASSLQVLTRLGLTDAYARAPEAVLTELHAGLAPTGDEDRLFALAELAFHHAERDGARPWYAASAVYAWAFLFPGEGSTPPSRSEPRTRLAFDLYNRALTAGITGWRDGRLAPGVARVELPMGTVELATRDEVLHWAGRRVERVFPAADFAVRGLQNRYRRPGIGAPLAATFGALEATGAEREIDQWVQDGSMVPLTLVVRFPEARQRLASGELLGEVEIYTADVADTVEIDGEAVPIEFEMSSSLAHTLSEPELWSFSLRGFFSGGYQLEDEEHQLRMLYPWIPGRIPVVLVHGTASNPGTWAELVNELLNDRRLTGRIQLWLFQYNTGNPILYSAGILREQLAEAVETLDPEGRDPALRQMVVIGHSQGGLLTRLTATDAGDTFWRELLGRPVGAPELDLEPATRAILERSLTVEALPFVERVIFISTPHRGSYLAAFRLANVVSSLVRMPTRLAGLSVQVLTLNEDALALRRLQRLPTSVDNMRPGAPLLEVLDTLPIAPGVEAHSIIPVKGEAPPDGQSDGVVRYESAHLEGVSSEKIVYHSQHSTQGRPEAILEVKRILFEQLGADGAVPEAESLGADGAAPEAEPLGADEADGTSVGDPAEPGGSSAP